MANYLTIDDVASNDVLSVTYLNQIVNNYEILSAHNHSPSAGEGNNTVISASGASVFVPRLYFFPSDTPEFWASSGVGLPVITVVNTMPGNNVWGFNNSNALGDWIRIQTPLYKGIYSLDMMYLTGASGGKANVIFNSSTLGTAVDTYASAAGSGTYAASNLSIPSSASYILQLQLTSKNVDSAGDIIQFGGLTLVRTRNG